MMWLLATLTELGVYIIGARDPRTGQFSEDHTRPANFSLEPHFYPILDTFPPSMSYPSPSTSESSLQSTEKSAKMRWVASPNGRGTLRGTIVLLFCLYDCE